MNNLKKLLFHVVFYIGLYCFLAFVISLIFDKEMKAILESFYSFIYITLGWIPNVIIEEDLEKVYPTKD